MVRPPVPPAVQTDGVDDVYVNGRPPLVVALNVSGPSFNGVSTNVSIASNWEVMETAAAVPRPTALFAASRNAYVEPGVRPVTVADRVPSPLLTIVASE
jgi:hypothetical protein